MNLVHKVKVSFDADAVYLMDGLICRSGAALALTTSSQRIMVYDSTTAGHLLTVGGHTEPLTDIVVGNQNSDMLYSIQNDTGVMITDLRVGKGIHFLTELTHSGKAGNSLSISPSDMELAIAAGGDINRIDTRTWHSIALVESLHSDDITRLRYCTETWICSAGEDQLISLYDISMDEDDMMISVVNCGESCNKMRCFPQHQFVALTGTCENAYVLPLMPDAKERKLPRRDFRTYIVDFVEYGDTVLLAMGQHAPEEEEGVPAPLVPPPLELLDVRTGQVMGTLAGGHEDNVRVILKAGDGFISAGEDGVVAWWGTQAPRNPAEQTLKQRPQLAAKPHPTRKGPY
jgi:hypothetical protein